jgi:hypothetical protein
MEEGPQPRQCASDSAYWAVGEALIEECGTDPVWDYDEGKIEFKGGLKLYEAADWLDEHGVENYGPWDLCEFRSMAESFPPNTRSMHTNLGSAKVCRSGRNGRSLCKRRCLLGARRCADRGMWGGPRMGRGLG